LDEFRLPNDFSGLKPYHGYDLVRIEIVRLVPVAAKFILHVGCRGGVLGRALKDEVSGRTVWGMESNREMAKDARRNLDRVIGDDIENAATLLSGDALFDCIICADVLENLKDPWTLLDKLLDHLAPDGRLVCSTHNIQYYKVIKDIIRDRWLYRAGGCMDRDHLRFFSLATIRNLFATSGYRILTIENKKLAGKLVKIINRLLSNKLDKFLTHQYLVVCARRKDV
jgi:2-polyprenyl-3-methyl-5-hydroxy-6-metoxy-1,4-benzoquinol methylase